jgi:VCBS repeat-containing protein
MVVGHQGKGTVRITNADSSVTNTFGATIGEEAGSYGSVSVDNNGTWTVGSGVYGVGIYIGGTNTGAGGTGLVSVTSGGSVSAVSVYVWGSGTLTGNGTVNVNSGSGTATFDGTLAPNGGGGTLSLVGSLHLDGGATTQSIVTPHDPSTTPQVSVSAQASLGGRLSVTMTGDFSSAPRRFTLLHADTFDVNHSKFDSQSITYPTGQGCWIPQITYDYTGGHLSVYLDRVYNCN